MLAYAKADRSERLEDFTTEALALAIKADPTPIINVLVAHGVVDAGPHHHVAPMTQVAFEHKGKGGRLDMVLQIDDGSPTAMEVWFENKAHAPEGAGQLARYRRAIDATPTVKRELVVLAPHPISKERHHTFIRWQEVADAATSSTSAIWADFATFLKEKHMTADATLPVSESEAASLGDAFRLFQKMRHLMRRVNERAREVLPEWPSDKWVDDGSMRRVLMSDFGWNGCLRLHAGKGYAADLVMGATPRSDGLRFLVLVEADRTMTEVRSRLVDSVAALLPDWERPENRARVLGKESLARWFTTDDEAVDWFVTCLVELKEAGIISLIPTLSKGPLDERASDVEPSGSGE